MRKLLRNDDASAIPLILFIFGLIGAGGFYTFFFIVVGPSFHGLIPDGMMKTLILGIIYFVPAIILIVGGIALILSGMKNNPSWKQQGGMV